MSKVDPTILKFGMKGQRVKLWQRALITLGYLPKGADDGVWGNQTEGASLKFLKAQKLVSTSYNGRVAVGPKSKEAANRAVAAAKKPKPPAKPSSTKPPVKPKPPIGAPKKPEIIQPEKWDNIGQAKGYSGTPIRFDGREVVVHYGGIGNKPGPTTRAGELALVRSWARHHRNNNKWPGGLGYAVVVAESGRAYLSYRGKRRQSMAACGNAKNVRFGGQLPNHVLNICLMTGDNQVPSDAAAETVAWLCKHYNTLPVIRRHSEADHTSCPGKAIPTKINSSWLRRRLAA